MNAALTLSVRQLVEFACRGGDLASGPRGPSALEGIRAHQRWQRRHGKDYRAEVPVRATLAIDGYAVTLQGRVDLLRDDGPLAQLEEIKSCYCAPEYLPAAQRELQWAQLMVYGCCYLLARQTAAAPETTAAAPGSAASADRLELCLTWLTVPQDQAHREQRSMDLTALRRFTVDALRRYLRWQQLIDAQRLTCQRTAAALDFPYPAFRPGQRTMAAHIYRALRDGNQLLCEAPTGIGKTISALFPAIKALGTQQIEQIFYLTAKNSGRQAAAAALQALTEGGLDLCYLVIQAKKTACHCSNGSCERDSDGVCPRCPGFFDRLPAAREDLLRLRHLDSATIDAVAQHYQLCPFELSLQMLPWATVVICDYNYAFDPLVALGWFKDNPPRVALLLDEAHNLVDRARHMHSARLERRQLRYCAKLGDASHPAIARALRSVDRALGRWHQDCSKTTAPAATRWQAADEEQVSTDLPLPVVKAVTRLSEAQASQPADAPPLAEELADCLRETYRFGAIAELFGDHHRAISRRAQRKTGSPARQRNILLHLQCLDASAFLSESYQSFHAMTLFSATLRPQSFYRQALGLDAQCAALSLPSPFAPAQQATLLCAGIDTRYRQRDQAIVTIAELIHGVYHSRPGNYMVFFASYHFMTCVADAVRQRYPSLPIRLQQRAADEQQRAAFLAAFDADAPALGFAIMGGVFGEGVDYAGDRLIGAIVIGTGLPGVGTEQELIRQDYQGQGLDGFDFAYRFPGLSRVLQAAGRVIRSESDRGVVLLVDRRFATPGYRDLLPEHWRPRLCQDNAGVAAALREFWSASEGLPDGLGDD